MVVTVKIVKLRQTTEGKLSVNTVYVAGAMQWLLQLVERVGFVFVFPEIDNIVAILLSCCTYK